MPLSRADTKRKPPLQKSSSPITAQAQPTTLPAVSPGIIQRARGAPTQLLGGDLQYLQRTIGNRAVGQMLSSRGNLRVRSANDRYEREAAGVAEQVSGRVSNSAPTRQTSYPTVQRNALPQVGPEGGRVESGLARQIEQGKQGGRPLPRKIRRQVEESLGADFSAVRVHTDKNAEQTNQALGARAFTHGKDIFLGAQQSPHDVQLMAHELTHTIQQGAVVPNTVQRTGAPGKVQRAPTNISSTPPHIQRENETIKFQGKSKSITKGDEDQFSQSIVKMSTKGVSSVGDTERPRAIMLMGAAGSGKSSLIPQLVPDPSNFVHVDADQVKEAMPEYQSGLEEGDTDIANTVHTRSKNVAKSMATEAIATRRNLIFDATGSDVAQYMTMITAMRDKTKNYHITLAMSHLSPDEGVRRVAERAQQTGREIPENVVRDMYQWVPRNFPTLANQVDQAYLFDNMVPQGQPPIIVWETSNGTKLSQAALDHVLELLTGIEDKTIDDTAPEDDSYHPPMITHGTGRYLQEGGTSRWQKDTTTKKKGFSVSRKNLSEVDESIKLYRLYKSKNRGNAEEQAKLLKGLESSVTKSNYQGNNLKNSKTHLRRRSAMDDLREELKGEFRRNALRLIRVASYGEQVAELVKVGMTPAYLNGLLKMDVQRLYEAHVALAFRQKDLAQKAFDQLNPVEREQTGELKYEKQYLQRSRDRLHFAQQILTAHHHENIGGDYSQNFAPGDIDEQRMDDITTNYIRNGDFLGGVVQDVKKPLYGTKLKDVVKKYRGVLSSQELEAIRIYSSDTYKQINATMQDLRVDDPETQKGFKGYSSISQVAVSGLSKLPSYAGPMLYRGDRNFGGITETARVGTSFQTPTFMSTSKNAARAENFGFEVAWIVLPAPNSRGKDIEEISVSPREEEVIFPPGTKMQVADVIRAPQPQTIPNGEKPPAARERVRKTWKTDSGKPIKDTYLNFMQLFRGSRKTLIVLREVK